MGHEGVRLGETVDCPFQKQNEAKLTVYYLSETSICLARLQTNFTGTQIYLQPAKVKSEHFGLLLKLLVRN